MSSLNTFGAILSYAAEMEARLQAYYQGIGKAELAIAADKRRKKLERVRRENVVEITLEPIEGLDTAKYSLDWRMFRTMVNRRRKKRLHSFTVMWRQRSTCARHSARLSAVARSTWDNRVVTSDAIVGATRRVAHEREADMKTIESINLIWRRPGCRGGRPTIVGRGA